MALCPPRECRRESGAGRLNASFAPTSTISLPQRARPGVARMRSNGLCWQTLAILAIQAGLAFGFGASIMNVLVSRHTVIEALDIIASVAA